MLCSFLCSLGGGNSSGLLHLHHLLRLLSSAFFLWSSPPSPHKRRFMLLFSPGPCQIRGTFSSSSWESWSVVATPQPGFHRTPATKRHHIRSRKYEGRFITSIQHEREKCAWLGVLRLWPYKVAFSEGCQMRRIHGLWLTPQRPLIPNISATSFLFTRNLAVFVRVTHKWRKQPWFISNRHPPTTHNSLTSD